MKIHLSFSSIRIRLLLLIVLGSVPVLLFTVHNALDERRVAEAQIQAEILQLTRLTVSNQEQWIEGARQLLVSLAHLQIVRNRDSAACSRFFAELCAHYPLYANISAATPDGDLFCSAVPLKEEVNVSDMAWFRRAVSNRDLVLGDYQIGQVTGVPVLVAAYPVYDDGGSLQAVVRVSLGLTWVNEQAAEAQLASDETFLAIDRRGTILSRYPDPANWTGKSLPAAGIISAALNQKEGTAQVAGVDGVTRLYAFAPVRSRGAETGIFIAIGIDPAVAYAEVNHKLVRSIGWSGMVTLLLFLVAWVGSDVFILRHVNALVSATLRLGAGELGARTGVPYDRGEVGQLARVFDGMAESLEQREAERKQAEATVGQQARTLDAFFTHTITPIVILDRDFNFIRVNEAYAEAGQRDVSKFPGHNHFEFYPSEATAIFEEVVATKVPYQTLARPFVYPDHPEWGVTYWDWRLTPLLDDRG